jgi:hypothetical protein
MSRRDVAGFGFLLCSLLLSGGCGGLDDLVQTPSESVALARAESVRAGSSAAEVRAQLGSPDFVITTLPDGRERVVRVASGAVVLEDKEGRVQRRYGCRTLGNWRGAGPEMWVYDLETTVKLCLYLTPDKMVVGDTEVVWH